MSLTLGRPGGPWNAMEPCCGSGIGTGPARGCGGKEEGCCWGAGCDDQYGTSTHLIIWGTEQQQQEEEYAGDDGDVRIMITYSQNHLSRQRHLEGLGMLV